MIYGDFSLKVLHESLVKTAQLLRIDLDAVRLPEGSLSDMLGEFTGQLVGNLLLAGRSGSGVHEDDDRLRHGCRFQ